MKAIVNNYIRTIRVINYSTSSWRIESPITGNNCFIWKYKNIAADVRVYGPKSLELSMTLIVCMRKMAAM